MRYFVVAFASLFAALAHAKEARLPVPPIPPMQPPTLAAPVPDPDLAAIFHPTSSVSVTLDTTINHRAAPDSGFGYAPGARYQLDDNRRFALPGVLVRVPLP